MIKRVVFTKFKGFSSFDKPLNPEGITVVAGGNNSGKSTFLHGLAVWEFAKLLIELEKGRDALNAGHRGDGVGISFEDFTPVNIPSLKYLWTNLTSLSGYQLKIKCYWDLPQQEERYLEISFSLVQERLYMKNTDSNLNANDRMPTITYLPPFAGITDREQWYSQADRRKLLGRGLAGSLLRNTIIDLHQKNVQRREELRQNGRRIPKAALQTLRETDPFERLNQILFEIFKIQLHPLHFDSNFHNYVKVELSKGEMVNNRYAPFTNFNKRDIMVEGSGFLQWLSVYTYALDPKIDVLLLDEPDAHLHSSLETTLLKKLSEIASHANKQVFIATHSSEIIKYSDAKAILHIQGARTRYLQHERQKIALIAGLGTEYSPLINNLQRYRRVIFTENASDWDIICEWFRALNIRLPQNIVVWPLANDHDQRKHLFLQLKDEIPNLQGISLKDRDNSLYETTANSLIDSNRPPWVENNSALHYLKWRRWEIENYLIHPAVISRVTGVDEPIIRQFILDTFGIAIPINLLQTDRTDDSRVIFDIEGKLVLSRIEQEYRIQKIDIAREVQFNEVFADAITLVNQIRDMCNLPIA